METPEVFDELLSKGIITEDMLGAALFSLNKRAKNYRNQKRKGKKSIYAQAKLFGFDNPDDPDEAKKMEKEMYRKKELLLRIVEPVCIHKELAGYKKEYIYDKDRDDYADIFIDSIFHNRVLDRGICRKEGQDIRFFVRRGEPYYRYYFFRCVGDHTYHTPTDQETALNSGLPIHMINEIKTEGEKEEKLISEEFVDKIITLVESGQFSYIPGNTSPVPRENIYIPGSYTTPQEYEWDEVVDILREKYPENATRLKKVDLSIGLLRRIMKREVITAEDCINCILADKKKTKRCFVK